MAESTVALSNSPPQLETDTKRRPAKRAAIYTRVSTADQHPETQLYDLREMAKQRGYEIAHEYSDVICGAKSKRPGLDTLMADARRRRFDVVLVAAFDRVARSVRHFLDVLDELKANAKSCGLATIAPHDLRRTRARLCHQAGGELEQIQFLLGHVSVQTTERYLGCKQRFRDAVNDHIGLETDAQS